MLGNIQERIRYTFREAELLQRALTHPSYLQDRPEALESNQRLEFLGDAVLQLLLTETLFRQYPDLREGDLSRRRSNLSKGSFLSQLARELGVDEALRLGQSEEANGGRNRDSSLEDAVEAVIGAIFLDSDLATTRDTVLRWLGDLEGRLAATQPADNPKGRLQEKVQPHHGNNAIRYECTHVAGEDHARQYEATVYLLEKPLGSGRGTSKKLAEEAAAAEALARWTEPPAP
ncbi:ribonuclease III [Nibricoccus sp. IMCC34717]|uniref:ribonuclease III n=1 Tax=Nibricoccus sp. IMCC34717 TaxID=3034021 RepID=UPI003850A528